MRTQSIISPEDQNVTFVELFFDLVFVFAITQTVGLLHHDLDMTIIAQALLVFWLVWWAWVQFTWALNAADTTHSLITVAILAATGVAFFMAVALPAAFGERAILFAVAYVLVRLIGLIIYYWVSSGDPAQKVAVRNFILFSSAGMAAVLMGAFAAGTLQLWLWGAAILLDVLAGLLGGRNEAWNLHAEHFAERYGLIVIIALGESLIVAAGRVATTDWTAELLAVAVLAVAIACAFWWSYFPRTKPALDRAFAKESGARQAGLARDAYSIVHFVMVFGIVAYAVAVEEAVAHPSAALPLVARVALAAGLLLFVGGMALAVWRATRRLLLPRLAISLLAAAAVLLFAGAPAVLSLSFVLAGVLLLVLLEQRDPWLSPSWEGS